MTDQWMESAACLNVDPNVFFPYDEHGITTARDICTTCPVKTECLNYARDNNITHGIWGGTTPKQRTTQHRVTNQRKKPDGLVQSR